MNILRPKTGADYNHLNRTRNASKTETLLIHPSFNFRIADYNAINNNMSGIDWHSEFQTLDTNHSLQKHYSVLYSLFDKYVPAVIRTGSQK